jgi:hypothetical protein
MIRHHGPSWPRRGATPAADELTAIEARLKQIAGERGQSFQGDAIERRLRPGLAADRRQVIQTRGLGWRSIRSTSSGTVKSF